MAELSDAHFIIMNDFIHSSSYHIKIVVSKSFQESLSLKESTLHMRAERKVNDRIFQYE